MLAGPAATTVSCGSALGGGLKPTSTLRYQGWPAPTHRAELAEDLGYLQHFRLEWAGNTISGPQGIQTAATGEVDFGGAFNGAIANMAAAQALVKAVITWGRPNPRPRRAVSVRTGSATLRKWTAGRCS